MVHIGDSEIVELLQELSHVPVVLDHAVGVEPEARLPVRLRSEEIEARAEAKRRCRAGIGAPRLTHRSLCQGSRAAATGVALPAFGARGMVGAARAGRWSMLVVTTPSLEGRTVKRYLGLVSGDAILGANIFRDLFAGIRDIVGGRSAAYEKELRKAKTLALEEMEAEAAELGANAIVAVDLDYETITLSGGGGMLMVSASGTAVVLE
jgi:uncharacterized protein YbjQ (UPF0145 family)